MSGGEGRCGGNALSSNSVCIANGWIFKVYTLQRYRDKNHKFLFSRTRVKYLDHKKRACIVCMSQYMIFGLSHNFCLFDFILYVPSTIFQLCRYEPAWFLYFLVLWGHGFYLGTLNN